MKRAVLLFLLITAFIGAKAQDEPKLPPDLDMLKFFYTAYMKPFVDGAQQSDLSNKQSKLRRTFCTPRCLQRYQQLMQEGDDPFIKAPGSSLEAIKSLEFKKDPKQPNKYIVSYDDLDKVTIELSLVKEKDEWKIDYLY